MKKRYLAVPLALGVAGASWAGGTLYGGSEARQAYDRLLADIDEASGLALVPISYEAGFLNSEAVTELRVAASDEGTALMRFRHRIEHSPVGDSGLRGARIVTTADTSALDPELGESIASAFDGESPITADSVIGLDGSADHTIRVAAWNVDTKTVRVAAEPVEWTVRESAGDAVSGTGFWPGLSVTTQGELDVVMTLGASHDRFDFRKIDDVLYVGEYVAELGDLGADSVSTGMSGTLSGMRLSSVSDIVAEAYRGDVALEIASMDIPVELDSLRLQGRFDGFPVDGMKTVTKAADTWNSAAFGADEAAMEAALQAYIEAFGELLEPGLSLGYGLELANAGGRAVADYDMQWTDAGGASALAGMRTLGDVVRAVRATLTLDVDGEALAMTPAAMFIDPAALAPWVITDADGYRSDITIEDLVMNVNGQPMPLEQLAGAWLATPLGER